MLVSLNILLPILICNSVYLPDILFYSYLIPRSLQNPFSQTSPYLVPPILSLHYYLQLSPLQRTHLLDLIHELSTLILSASLNVCLPTVIGIT